MEYLNSKISLISRSDIRYTGILHNINSKDSTISLQNVRSYGTEGRKGNPREEIPPSDNIFEYIVFRGSDVKDLHIEEPAPHDPVSQIPNDPAILRTTAPSTLQSPQGYSYSCQPYPNTPKYPPYKGYNDSPSLQIGDPVAYYDNVTGLSEHPVNSNHSSKQLSQMPLTHGPSSLVTDSRLCSLLPTQNKTEIDTNQVSSLPKQKPIALAMPLPTRAKTTQAAPKQNESEKLNTVAPNSSPKTQPASASAPAINNKGLSSMQNLENKISKLNIGSNLQNSRLPGMGSHLVQQYRNRRRDNGDKHLHNVSKENNIPEEEFDFLHWNAKFNKKEILKTPNIQKTNDANNSNTCKETYYDSKTSFFDNISCENKERIENKDKENSRAKRIQERNQDLETFGQIYLPGTKKYGRRRGRGGFRGGYRGFRHKNNNKNQHITNGEST